MDQNFIQRFYTARKKYILSYYNQLNERQQEAVLKTEGPLLILAGAGSGKTTVLIQRITNILRFGKASDSIGFPTMLEQSDVEYLEQQVANGTHEDRADFLCSFQRVYPSNILAITFTNKAAQELKERLTQCLGDDGASVWAMTFHSACCRILRREIDRLGYSSNFTIYDTADSEKVMKEILRTRNLDEKSFPPKMLLNAISRAKDKLIDAEQYRGSEVDGGDYRNDIVAGCYRDYQVKLQSANAVDFDDIIVLTVKLLREYDEVREYYSNKFRYILVDEYQDTNYAQYVLTSLLAGKHGNICVVGDDDQSIYKFRGATIQNILDFETCYPGTKIIRLEQNYRSTEVILRTANELIRNNRARKGKELWTQNGHGDQVCVFEADNQYSEADFVTSELVKLSKKGNFRDCAVLYRTNAQSNVFEQVFSRVGIPYRIIGGIRFFDRAEVKDAIAYLTVIDNSSDDLRLKRILNVPARGIGAKTLEQAERLSDSLHLSLFEVLEQSDIYPALQKSASKLKEFVSLISTLREQSKQMDLPEFYDKVLQSTGYLAFIENKDADDGKGRTENVMELRSNIVSYCAESEQPSLRGFLEEISLYTDIEQYNAAEDCVVMMTMHSAKGLEFPNVFLVGFEEGLFPSFKSSTDTSDIEEERRLCYVAVTRAKHCLYISFAHERMLYGHTAFNSHSRFIDELPTDCCSFRHSSGLSSLQCGKKNASGSATHGTDVRRNTVGTTPARPARSAGIEKSVRNGSSRQNIERIEYQVGNIVQHRSFGRGMVLTAVKVGNDTLLEIAFDSVGTKKMLSNSASAYMVKL